MHPLLRQWPSERFYRGQLIDAAEAAARAPPAALPRPLVYCEVAGAEERALGGASRLPHRHVLTYENGSP